MRGRFAATAILLALCCLGTAQAEVPPAMLSTGIQVAQPGIPQTFFSLYWPWLSGIFDVGLLVAVVLLWRMRRKNRLLQRALDQTSEAMYIQDASLRFVDVNDAACRMLGYSREELLRMGPMDIDPDVTREAIKQAFQAEGLGIPHAFESRHRARDGRIFPVELTGTFFEDGGMRYVVTMVRDISERKRLEERLVKSEFEFRSLAEHAPDNIIRYDRQFRFLYCNPQAERTMGRTSGELAGKMSSEVFAHGEYDEVGALLKRTLAGKQEMEHVLATPDYGNGGRIHHLRCVPEFGEDGEVVSLLLFGRDMTDVYRMQETIAMREREFRSLADNLPDNIARWDTEARLLYDNPVHQRTLGKSAAEILGKTQAEVFPGNDAYAAADESIVAVARSGEERLFEKVQLVDGNGEIRFHDIKMVPEFDESGRAVSVLGIGRDMTEIYRMQEAIAAREREFRSLAENIPDNIARWDTLGRYLYINPTHERLLGVSATEIVGREIADIHARVKAGIAQVVKTGQALLVERQTLECDGKVLIHDVSLAPEFDDAGCVVSVLGLGRDMTDIYRMQEAIAVREQEFRSLAEGSPDFIVRYDRAGRQRYINSALVKRLGLDSADQSQGLRPGEFWTDGRFDVLEKAAERVVASGQIENVELYVLSGSGEGYEYHQLLVAPERDADGKVIGTIAFGRDVTAIRENGLRLKHFIDRLPGMAFTFQRLADGQARFPYVSSDIEHFFGLGPQDVAMDFAPFRRLLHPDDVAKVDAAMAASASSRAPFQIELRVCRPGFPLRWLDVRAMPGQEAEDGILWYGIMLDVTERKLAELALEASREQLRGLIVQRENAREEERKYIAREIHDDLGQILTGVKMGMSVIEDEVAEATQARQRVAEVKALTETAITVMRNISAAIRPVELDMGIAAALQWQAQRFATFSGLACKVDVGEGADSLDEAQAATVFRLAQEALTNVARHANAQHVHIALGLEHAEAVLRIEDDGCGFDPAVSKAGSFGLVGMKERALMLGGALSIDSRPHAGTRLEVRFPVRHRQEAR